LEQRELQIAQLETRLNRKNRDDNFDKNLPNLAKILGKDFKPVVLCGGQGAGKGTTTIYLINHYSSAMGCIPLCLDVGEGIDRDSTWYRAGVPATNNVKDFLDIMRLIVEKMDSYAHRNKIDEYQKTAPIILIFDELQTILLNLNSKERKEFIELSIAFHTRGHKRKIFPIFCNQSYQIQNMGGKASNEKLLNGGQINNFHKILFNKEITKYLEEKKKSIPIDFPTRQYLESFEGMYKCALIGDEGLIIPVKHPSHYRQKEDNGIPCQIPEKPIIGNIPEWLETAFNRVFLIPDNARFYDGSDDGSEVVQARSMTVQPCSSSNDSEPAKPATDGGSSHSERYEKIKSLSGELGIDENELSCFEDVIIGGMGKGKAIESILRIKKGGSKRYKIASELYEVIKNV